MTDNVHYLNQPNYDCVSEDKDGVPMYKFSISWTYKGGTFSTTFWARNMKQAKKHVAAMKRTLTLDGQIMATEEGEM